MEVSALFMRSGDLVRLPIMWVRTLGLTLACSLLCGCYVMQAATGQFDVMRRSEPISNVLADPATTASTRSGLERVVAARAFAEKELGLPASRSFREYADLGRPYVVWNVVATPEFSVDPLRWLRSLSRLFQRKLRPVDGFQTLPAGR